jgi:hypothetical protein
MHHTPRYTRSAADRHPPSPTPLPCPAAPQATFAYLPAPPKVNFSFEASNAGPLYFLICLTAGVVIPALRRSKILDIKTLEEDMGAASVGAQAH